MVISRAMVRAAGVRLSAWSVLSTWREAKVMDNVIETRRPACPWGKHVSVEALGEDAIGARMLDAWI
jgi:hypothetical protein